MVVEAGDEECLMRQWKKKKKKSSINGKRKFSDEQIRTLEMMFESESKLEPTKKLELAREVGLQPRQVAIWFQNKRARWKSKQLERDYSKLKANYNSLASKLEFLNKENQSLILQLEKLHDEMEKRQTLGDGKSENGHTEIEAKPREGLEGGICVVWDDDRTIKAPHDLLLQPGDGSLTSLENWGCLDSDAFLEHSTSSSYQWWDFWC